jgi:thioester reductase-like protein
MPVSTILITGANGYVGAKTAERILASTQSNVTPSTVTLWVHAGSEAEAQSKIEPLRARFQDHASRVEFAWGELGDAEPFASVDPASVVGIVHGAAVTRFNVDYDTAQRVNVVGAEKVFRFAERCTYLNQLTYVSTVYASGLASGDIAEETREAQSGGGIPEGFANHYERSKFEAEQILVTKYSHLPWRIARVATVIADDDRGGVTQQNAVHNTLKLFFYGLLSLVPGKPQTPLYFVTGDFVAGALSDVIARGANHSVYQIVHTRKESITLDELVTIAFEAFAANEGFRTRRVLKPLYADAESFDILVDGLDSFGGDVLRQALGSVAPFARQLFVHKDFKNDRLRTSVVAYRAPSPRDLVRATCEELVRTRWGKASKGAGEVAA